MKYDKLLERLNNLIDLGETILTTKQPIKNRVSLYSVDESLFHQWRAGSLSFIQKAFGENYILYKEYNDKCKNAYYRDTLKGLSILKAVKEDLEGDYFYKIEDLVLADMFNDFLEMAEYLLNNGFKDPAASLIGAVLENGLKKIAKKNCINLREREDIGSLNDKLKNNVYNTLKYKEIKFWNDIRNQADHGNFQYYTDEDVKRMLLGVRDFLSRYL